VKIQDVEKFFPMSSYSGPYGLVIGCPIPSLYTTTTTIFHILYFMSGLGKLEEINRQVNLEFEFYRFRHAFVDGFTKSKLLNFNYLFNSPLTLFILVILYFWLRKLF